MKEKILKNCLEREAEISKELTNDTHLSNAVVTVRHRTEYEFSRFISVSQSVNEENVQIKEEQFGNKVLKIVEFITCFDMCYFPVSGCLNVGCLNTLQTEL